MNFKDEIDELENIICDDEFIILKGKVSILFSAPHTMLQKRIDGTVKLSEPYTKAISLYLNKYYNTYAIVKNKDTGIDSNADNYDTYNIEMRRLIKDNNIKLVIDLEETFIENGITNIKHNNPFKGGAITKGIFSMDNVDVIQLEINRKYRDSNNLVLLEKLINSLVCFVKQYSEYINR